MNAENIVVDLIALHGGELVGRTRLQKEAYLLHRCGANFGLGFTYHHYGPYSFDLAEGLTDALAEERITIEERPGRHRVPYAIFRSKNRVERPTHLGRLSADEAHAQLQKMDKISDIVLELAATVVFLRDEWDYYDKGKTDAVEETKARKPLKATEERIAKAIALLRYLGLWKCPEPATP